MITSWQGKNSSLTGIGYKNETSFVVSKPTHEKQELRPDKASNRAVIENVVSAPLQLPPCLDQFSSGGDVFARIIVRSSSTIIGVITHPEHVAVTFDILLAHPIFHAVHSKDEPSSPTDSNTGVMFDSFADCMAVVSSLVSLNVLIISDEAVLLSFDNLSLVDTAGTSRNSTLYQPRDIYWIFTNAASTSFLVGSQQVEISAMLLATFRTFLGFPIVQDVAPVVLELGFSTEEKSVLQALDAGAGEPTA
ncbi:hypothetical protein BKA58DRAFT_416785 [Alternaria rosae]|uniref:uncharacterized protein n=1 Tax=Alternaria rosae TaxID=1187941 RepID=UPI001E8D5702|nr:uncharacterized protein BKA58DRAFT_416785 [Alternaria rosae]KAH6882920.1 hypothetical protein BKA58DRAFT_416785 [Alternaria rosae]